MAITSSSLVLYHPSATSTTLFTKPSSASLISSRLFSQQTGTAIATELLYRLLFDIINCLIASFQQLASRGMEDCSTWLERKMEERRERLAATKDRKVESLGIAEEVGKLALQSGFVACPMTGHPMDARMGGARGSHGPPMWVRSVLEGIDEGRMHDGDFWVNTHGD